MSNSNNKAYYGQKKMDTPLTARTPKSAYARPTTKYNTEYCTQPRDTSDSEESTKSGAYSDNGISSGSGNNEELSIVAEFDELMRCMRQQLDGDEEVFCSFMDFIEQTKLLNERYVVALQECQRLQVENDKKTHEGRELESKLRSARMLLDQERKRCRKLMDDRDNLEDKINHVGNCLFNDVRVRLPEETRQELAFLSSTLHNGQDVNGIATGQLSAIPEVNTTGSLLSDFSYSMSEDGLDTSALQCGKSWKKHRPSAELAGEPVPKKRRSGGHKTIEINATETVRATTTLTMGKTGPITATSIIESIPPEMSTIPTSPGRKVFSELHPSAPPEHLIYDLWQRDSPRTMTRLHHRQHSFQTKTVVMPETCGPCEKRIRFGKTALKCKDCRAICHPECKDNLPIPCIPIVNTPTQRNMLGLISDYTPAIPPMVPALIIHCVNEIELRGLKELGIYRVPGAERDVKALKEKFLKSKGGVPSLIQIDVHTLCGTVKDFLRSLHEPLTTYARWSDFSRAVEAKDKKDIAPALYQIISELPRPNRDTLAYMMLHLKKVGDSPDCKMPMSNLAKIFGPTIVGYSSGDPNPQSIIFETKQQTLVMQHLIELPLNYWDSFVNCGDFLPTPTNKLQQTPSTDSLLCATAQRGLFTPHGLKSTTRRKQKVFPSSPAYK